MPKKQHISKAGRKAISDKQKARWAAVKAAKAALQKQKENQNAGCQSVGNAVASDAQTKSSSAADYIAELEYKITDERSRRYNIISAVEDAFRALLRGL